MAKKKESSSSKSCLSTLLVLAIIAGLVYYFWPTSPPEDGDPKTETITVKGVSFKMVYVKGGTFNMGHTQEQGFENIINEKPVHQVTLSDFYIGQTEVTQALWIAVMSNNMGNGTPKHSSTENLNRPVGSVSWEDCQRFVAKLNQLTGKNFRLPTEAEWEYAARGGKKSKGYKYAGSNNINEVAWCGLPDDIGPKNVATKSPNELGVYDMSGNVFEWVQDKYGSYSGIAQIDPTGCDSGSFGVYRGGAWNYDADFCRVSYRGFCLLLNMNKNLGLRLAL